MMSKLPPRAFPVLTIGMVTEDGTMKPLAVTHDNEVEYPEDMPRDVAATWLYTRLWNLGVEKAQLQYGIDHSQVFPLFFLPGFVTY